MTDWPGTDPKTNSNGYYSGTVSYGWSGTITPSKSGYSFTPESKTYSNVTSNQSNQNYTGSQGTRTISGYVKTSGGSAISGVTMTDWPGTDPTTDSSGYYSGTVSYGWSGTITPSKSGYSFSPASKTYSNVTSNQSNQNYTGSQGVTLPEAVDNSTLTWTTDGDAEWFGQTSVSHDGNDAAQSGGITHSQSSRLQTSVTGPGTVSFWWKASSEPIGDKLSFYVDSSLKDEISGEVDWEENEFEVTSGQHVLKWVYSKDTADSKGNDCGWVDQITYVPGGVTLSYISVSGPTSVNENSSADYTCTANYSDGSTKNVTSSTTWSENSSYASIDSSGHLTTESVTSDKTFTVTAAYGGKSDTHGVTIKNVPPTLNSIKISGPTSVYENSSADYTCTANYSDGSTKNVTSSATWAENCSYASINSSGHLTTDSVSSDKTCTITAAYGGKSATHVIKIVNESPAPEPNPEPDPDPPDPDPDWGGFKTLETKVAEEVLPLSRGGDPDSEVAPFGSIAIRLSAASEIDPSSVWVVAKVEGNEVLAQATWRPVDPSGDVTDGWVIVTLNEPGPVTLAGKLTLTVGALTMDGQEVGPVTEVFQIDVEKEACDVTEAPHIVEDDTVIPLPEILAGKASAVYRIGPIGVFDEPVAIMIPVPTGKTAEDLGIYYFSESERHRGWYVGENVVGWIVPGSRSVVEEDGQVYLQIEVNHSGVLQLGQTINVQLGSVASIDVGADGSPGQWFVAIATLLLLAALFISVGKRGRQHG